MNQITCPNCGAPNSADHRFCLKCGTALTAQKPVAPSSPGVKPLRPRPELFIAGGIGVFVLLSVCIVGLVIWVSQSEEPAVEATPEPQITVTTDELSETTSGTTLSPVDLYRLVSIAQEFSDPRTRQIAPSDISIVDLLGAPQDFAGQTVTITGELTQKTVIYNLVNQNWPRAYRLIVKSGDSSIPVVYRGYVGHLKPGDSIQVVGGFSATGIGIHADRISHLETAQPSQQGQSWIPLVIATIANLIWSLLCITIFLWRARRFRASRRIRRIQGGPPVVAMLIALFLTGCTIEIATTVNPDGSGTVGVTFTDTQENINFLRQMPGMNDYFDAWQASMRGQGVLVDDSLIANQERIHLQNVFGSVNDLAQSTPGVSAERSWVYAQMSTEGADRVFRYSSSVDTTALYESAPGVDPNIASEARKQLDETKITYSVTLPGQVVFHNATRVIGNQLIWDVRMNDRNEIKAESRLAGQPSENLSSLMWAAEVVIFVLFSALVPLSLLIHRVHKIQE